MKAVILRDKTVDWMERFFDSRGFELGCRAIIALAALYFILIALHFMPAAGQILER